MIDEKPPKRTAFHTDKNGNYRYTVTRADLHLNVKGVTTGKFVSGTQEISEKPGKNPKKAD